MAIYHLSAKVVSRGKGQSALAAAAYRSGDPLVDELTGELKSYDKRSLRIIHKEILAPAHAPEWTRDRNALWNAAERAEKRKDAQLAREIEVSLPHELTEQQRLFLVKDFAREAFVRRGYVVDLAIHTPDRGDARNHHAHLMITMRTIGPDGFAPMKDRSLNSTEQLEAWREQWAKLANRHLARHGHEARIDHRSLEAQGIDREPTSHVGYAGKEMAARGAQSDRVDELTGIIDRNAIRESIRTSEAELAELRELAANENRERRTGPARSREPRAMTDLPTDEELRQQPERETQYLKHMEFRQGQARALLDRQRQAQELEQRTTSFLQAMEIEAEEARKKQAEHEAAETSRGGLNGDISDASVRYSIAVGQTYDVRDPYASLARTAGAESAAFLRTQQELKEAAAKETNPEKRQAIELRRQIEGCEYMAITSDRLAAISMVVTGRRDNPHAVADRQKAADYRAMAETMRAERGVLLESIRVREASDRDQQASATASPPTARPDQASAQRSDSQSRADPYVPVHPTLPRSAAAPEAAPATAPERPAQQGRGLAPGHDSQPGPAAYEPVHPTLPRVAAAPEAPNPYVPVHPTLPRSAAAPGMPSPSVVPEPAARPDTVRAPQDGVRSGRAGAAPIPANNPESRVTQPTPAPSQPTPPREPARLDPQPFAAVALKPSYTVTMPKTAAPARNGAPPPEAPHQPSVERTRTPEESRTATRPHYRSEMPASAPEPETQNAAGGKGDKGKGERGGEAGAMPAPRRGDYRSLPSEVPEPRVVDREGRDVGSLSEFMKREQPRTSEPRPPVSTGELLRNSALRADYARHDQRMYEERQNADKALDRIGRDLEGKRPLRADDLTSLTRGQWDSVRTRGEAGLSQSVTEAKDRGAKSQGRQMTGPKRSRWDP